MDIQAQLRLSFYREIATLNQAHQVKLVQHVETGKVYVLKALEVYDRDVFEHLRRHPIPGIPVIQELVEEGKVLYVIEEYISGTTLREVLDTNGPVPAQQAVDWVCQLCQILRPLHTQSPPIIHRDIKPSNLILTSCGRLYLVDLDSAREFSRSQPQDTVLMGTAGYAAPEQYGFSQSQPATDLYAVGVLLNELLTGALPTVRRCGGRFGKIIDRCLQMEPSRRYPSVDALLQDLLPSPAPTQDQTETRETSASWLPPGFRGHSIPVFIAAALWYLTIFALSATLTVEGATTAYELTLNRIAAGLMLLGETFWLGNYRNIWDAFPLSSHPNRWMKALGVALWAFALLFVVVFVLVILTKWN